MPQQLQSGMPVMPLTSDCQIRFEAIDPFTGTAVSGVTVSLATISAVDVEGDTNSVLSLGPYMLVPGPTPVETPAAPVKSKGGL